jgi:hypothetical protein
MGQERPSIEECDHKNARRVQSPLPTEPGKVEQLWLCPDCGGSFTSDPRPRRP